MQKPPICRQCPLYKLGYSFSKPDGLGSNGVAIIGESLGDNEAIDGLPFRPKAASGSKLEEAFRINGYNRNQFLLWNVVACQPPGNMLTGAWYEQAAVNMCSNHFDTVVNGMNTGHFTRTILGLGNAPLRHIAGVEGYKQGVSFMRGYVLKSKYGPFISSYHPSFIRRGNPHLTPYLIEDMEKAVRVARGEFRPWEYKPEYVEFPGIDEAWAFYYQCKDNENLLITYDIETPMLAEVDESERDDYEGGIEIKLIQFSNRKGFGIAFPWEGEYIKIAKKLLRLRNNKANHNTWNFDNPILRGHGAKIRGRIDDTQWMFKHFHPALERGLQSAASLVDFPFPWKHYFGEKLNWYGCADVDAVQWLMDGLPKRMKDRGVWDGYDRHVYEIHTELEKASKDRGVPVNDEKRGELEEILKVRRKKVWKRCQKLVPLKIRNVTPSRKIKATGIKTYGYARTPKLVGELLAEYKEKAQAARDSGLEVKVSAKDYIYKKSGLVLRRFVDDDGMERWRWCKVLEFKPTSSKQVIKYIKWRQDELFRQFNDEGNKEAKELAKAYEVPLTIKDGKETTGKDALAELVEKTGDELLGMIGEYRSLNKMITNDIPNWKPRPMVLVDGEETVEYTAVSTTWGFVAPTGQLNTKKPNIQNASKHTAIGNDFRRIIEAPVGFSILEFDFRSFHVAVAGQRAQDESYVRFSQLDPHSIFTSYLDGIGLPQELRDISLDWEDERILAICKEIKKGWGEFRQRVAKPAVLGNQLGLGPRKLHLQNKKYITSQTMAEELQAEIAARFRLVDMRKEFIRDMADRQKFLKNDFGRIQYFYDIYNWVWSKKEGRFVKRNGTDSEKVLAFDVQSNAFGKVMEDILVCRDKGYNEKYNFNNTIHDSIVFMAPNRYIDCAIADIVPVLSRPCDKLLVKGKGLAVGVEVSLGRNMAKWDKDKNEEGMREIKI